MTACWSDPHRLPPPPIGYVRAGSRSRVLNLAEMRARPSTHLEINPRLGSVPQPRSPVRSPIGLKTTQQYPGLGSSTGSRLDPASASTTPPAHARFIPHVSSRWLTARQAAPVVRRPPPASRASSPAGGAGRRSARRHAPEARAWRDAAPRPRPDPPLCGPGRPRCRDEPDRGQQRPDRPEKGQGPRLAYGVGRALRAEPTSPSS